MENSQTDKKVVSSLDWLSLTYNLPKGSVLDVLPSHKCYEPKLPSKGYRGYEKGLTLACGATLYWTEDNGQLGVHMQATGETVAKMLMYYGMDDNEMVNGLVSRFFRKAARVDYAVDFFGHEQACEAIVAEIDAGRVTTRLKPYSIHKDWQVGNGAYTAYMGAPESDYRVRVYNKAAELDMLWLAWCRVECQARNEIATVAFVQAKTEGVSESFKALMNKKMRLDSLDWYAQGFLSKTRPAVVPAKLPKFEKWLMETVLPSIKDHYQKGEFTGTIEYFTAQIDAMIRYELSKQGSV